LRDITIRSIGATVVLLGIALAALMQMSGDGDPSAISLTADDATNLSTTGEVVEPSGTSTTAEPEPFVYRIGVLAGISTTNFWSFYGEQASVWNSYILGPTKPALYSLDETGDLQPELAMSQATPVLEADGWQVRIDLKDNFTWSDGEPITAEDFVFTFETVRSLGLGGSWASAFPDSIVSVKADSDYELRIEFAARPNLSLWPHGPGLAPLMPAHIWQDQTGSDEKALYEVSDVADVGGGPLTISEVSDEMIVSVVNPGYPSASIPDRVEYQVFSDESAAVLALTAGTIDTILSPKGLTTKQAEELSSDPGVVVETSSANGIRYLGFNLDREPMNDIAFRNAIALLIDRDALAEEIGPNGASTYAFVNPANSRWFDEQSAGSIAARFQGDLPDRLAAALAGLRDAGYSWTTEPTIGPAGDVVAGVGLKIQDLEAAPLTILTTGDALDPWRPKYASEIARTLGWVGFDVRPVETDFDTVVDLAFTPGEQDTLQYDMYLLGWTLGSPSLPAYYRTLFSTDGAQNNTGYASSTFAAQLAAYEDSFNVAEAREALWAMEKTLATDLPYLLLYSSALTEAYRADQVVFDGALGLGGLQAQLGGIGDVRPAS